jgi:YVTN family beta-propeller protein
MRRFYCFVLFLSLGLAALPSAAQTLIGTVNVGNDAFYLAANNVTNNTYVVNTCGSDPNCGGNGTVTVINGLTNNVTATITAQLRPEFVVANSVTNKIYVSNRGSNTVSVIDGATNTVIATIPVGSHPTVEDVNPLTNKIYVVNNGNGQGTTMSVIDGNTNTVTATVTVGNYPLAVSVNSITNKIYVANYCGNQFGCNATPAPGTVSVVDGNSNTVTHTITVGVGPGVIFVNPVTNKIWVMNSCGNVLSCDITGDNSQVVGTITQIDGTTLATLTANAGQGLGAMAINLVANKIYGSNNTDNTETVVDGVTLATNTVGVGAAPDDVEVNPVTNKIYVCNSGDNTVTMIDGATLTTTTTPVGNTPVEAWVNPFTDRVYVSNVGDNTVSVLGSVGASAVQFVSLPPCRVVDTRNPNGPFGGPAIGGGTFRDFPLPSGACNIPSTALGYSLNVTVVPAVPLGYLTIWPTGEQQPLVSTLNSTDGRIKANAAIVPAGAGGSVRVFASNTTQVVLDVNGYFEAPSDQTLEFHTLPPCRIADTRNTNGPLGGPFLNANQERDFPVLTSNCNIPNTAQAYSLNFTVVPHPAGEGLGYLKVWPTGQSQPLVSTLNNLTATIVANAAIVSSGTAGKIAVLPSQTTDLLIDIDGYFAPPGTGGLSLYPVAPCRVIDTRKGNGAFSGELPVNVVGSSCAPPSTAQAYVLNATVVPIGSLSYLTLWEDGQLRPTASTLNAIDGDITSNMAIVPTTNGSIDAYAAGTTQLVLDISSYFAP